MSNPWEYHVPMYRPVRGTDKSEANINTATIRLIVICRLIAKTVRVDEIKTDKKVHKRRSLFKSLPPTNSIL